ncbi:histidinol-phosphate aminotransferase [Salsuginibacillus halophilus]|uniref:Histidinol-phosphate aminotransferase n=1 Tax=Salsuginibacillus halophilus TaxID=517424 RepID=A0A2P8HQG5_9BACI|nr:histidinol-phosphate transaminase [Salsuginibacillus halophilus]PSL48459.1 histidinol-phosphate aminotransferase [Salsuginibacillus halophilus]
MSVLGARKQFEEIAVYSPGKPIEELKREMGITEVVKMASNENPFGASPKALEAMKEELTQLHYYPEITSPLVREKLANRLGISPDAVVVGNGSDEVIRMLTRTYLSPGEEVVMASVTFPRYKTNVIIEGGIPVDVAMKDGAHDLEAMLQAITSRTKMVFVCNPNNPTGTIVDKQELQMFIERVPKDVMVILDEAYYEFIRGDNDPNSLALLDKHTNLVILRTFSKIYGLASARIGYGIMHPEMVAELLKSKEPFNVNRMAQAGALAALDDEAFLHMTLEENNRGRMYLEEEAEALGLSYFDTHTNFIMIDVKMDAELVYNRLLEQGVIIRPGHMMGYPTMLRVTIGTKEQNEKFVESLKKALAVS